MRTKSTPSVASLKDAAPLSMESTSGSTSSSNPQRLMWIWGGYCVLALALGLRLLAARGDLAIDEIWSLLFAQSEVHHWFDVFALRHDNNHLLNTLILYDIGPGATGYWYRLPAVFASLASVWFGGKIVAVHASAAGRTLAWLILSVNSLLILYGTEARGYSYAVCCTYLMLWFLQRFSTRQTWGDAAGYAICSTLGLLSHLTFIYGLVGGGIWSFALFLRKPSWKLVAAQVPPLLMAGWLFVRFIPGMAIGGGPETNLLDAVISTLSLTFGGPSLGGVDLLAALATVVLISLGLVQFWKRNRGAAVAFSMAIVVSPAVVLAFTGHALIYPRYFLVPVAFALLLFAEGFLVCLRGGRFSQFVGLATLGLYCFGNLWWTADLLNDGRGHYFVAVTWLIEQGQGQPRTVSSDHDFRNGLVFGYHYVTGRSKFEESLTYVPQSSVPPTGTDWLIQHNFEGDPPFPETVTRGGVRYHLERVFRHHSLTGWNWWIYRRTTPSFDHSRE